MEKMKIYILTLGRVDDQLTYSMMPDYVKKMTYVVIQPHEEEAFRSRYPKMNLIVLPEEIKGASKTREWIYNMSSYEKFLEFDDDVELYKRNIDRQILKKNREVSRYKLSNKDDELWYEFLSHVNKNLDEYSMFGLNFCSSFPSKKEVNEFRVVSCVTGVNKEILRDVDFDWSLKFVEDLWFPMQACLNGHKIAASDLFLYETVPYAKGGCSTEGRTKEKELEAVTKLVEKCYYFEIDKNQPKNYPYVKVKKNFRQAYKSSKVTKLFF